MNLPKSPSMFKCELCKDTDYIPFEKEGKSYITPCYCLFKKNKTRIFGDKFKDSTIENYEGRNKSMIIAKEIITANPKGNYFIYGEVGLGKTHLLAGIYEMNFKIGSDWQNALVITEAELVKVINDIKIWDHSFYYIDDMGKIALNKWENLFTFYNDIYRYEKPINISSNYNLKQISEIYGGAIARRIEEQSIIIEIKRGDDNEKI